MKLTEAEWGSCAQKSLRADRVACGDMHRARARACRDHLSGRVAKGVCGAVKSAIVRKFSAQEAIIMWHWA